MSAHDRFTPDSSCEIVDVRSWGKSSRDQRVPLTAVSSQKATWLDGRIALDSGVFLWEITPPTARLCASCRGHDCGLRQFGTSFAVMAVLINQYAVLAFICYLKGGTPCD